MVNTIPENWEYNDSLEMLFLFYQKAEELLSENTPDTFALPMHNAITLLYEIEAVNDLLVQYGLVKAYYSKYVPIIIDELLHEIERDYILKKFLDIRLESIKTGLVEAKTNQVLLEKWLNLFKHSCSPSSYRKAYVSEISRLIQNTKDKDKLMYCAQNYFILLRHAGYSREYMYNATRSFFFNRERVVNSLTQIDEFLSIFDCKPKDNDFLILLNMDSIEYMDSISEQLPVSQGITKVDISKERRNLCKDYSVNELFDEYDRLIHGNKPHTQLAIVRFNAKGLDPYSTMLKFSEYTQMLQTFARYFKHFNYSKQIFKILLKGDKYYRDIKMPSMRQKRPFIDQATIDKRIRNILTAKSMSLSAFESIARAIDMHSEAFDSRSSTTLLRTLWTALETLFLNPNPNTARENAISSIIYIIQKTYILKLLRAVYSQLSMATVEEELCELGIVDFISFVEYFSSYSEAAPEMKRIYALLPNNPLLRSRIYRVRKELGSSEKIQSLLLTHQERMEWQLNRLYRIRNIATHLGQDMPESDIAINHLHNYFDYAVNYMLCKSENGDYISSITAVAFEAKIDIQIHHEYLKKQLPLSKETYRRLLFGSDPRIIEYQFEH